MPTSWNWCRLGVLFAHNTGKALNSSDTAGTKLTYITTSNLYWDRFELDNLKEMPFTESEIEKCTVKKGDLLVCEGGDIGRSAIWSFDEEIRIQNHIHRLRSYTDLSNRFYYYVLFLWKRLERIGGQGIGLQGFSSKALHKLIVPLPPHKEQITIVEKLDSILDSVDNLDELNSEFTIDVESVKKQILDLAIRGKLVPQNPGDEPASALLERIRAEKEVLIKQGKIKRDKKESVIFKGEDNSYYDIILPSNWTWSSISDVSISIADGSHNPPPNRNQGVPLLSAVNIFDNAVNYHLATRWITHQEWEMENKRTKIDIGDVLLTIVGTIGRTAIVKDPQPFALQRSVAVIKPCLINSEYLMFVLQSPTIYEWLIDNAKGNAQLGIYLKDLSKLIVPLPPIQEQSRLVRAIKTLFAQLDTILCSLS